MTEPSVAGALATSKVHLVHVPPNDLFTAARVGSGREDGSALRSTERVGNERQPVALDRLLLLARAITEAVEIDVCNARFGACQHLQRAPERGLALDPHQDRLQLEQSV